MHEDEQTRAIELLQEILLNEKKKRGNVQPEIREMKIYYLLSGLDALPDSYDADWPTALKN